MLETRVVTRVVLESAEAFPKCLFKKQIACLEEMTHVEQTSEHVMRNM
jgi:hypothetical protein